MHTNPHPDTDSSMPHTYAPPLEKVLETKAEDEELYVTSPSRAT